MGKTQDICGEAVHPAVIGGQLQSEMAHAIEPKRIATGLAIPLGQDRGPVPRICCQRDPSLKSETLGQVAMSRPGDAACRLLEAWKVNAHEGDSAWGDLTQWRIDMQTGRPVEVEKFHPLGVIRARFFYDAVNEPLPAAAFAIPKLEGVSPSPPEALDADYTERFINLRDGSDGRTSVRWGKRGPKGTSSSGLN